MEFLHFYQIRGDTLENYKVKDATSTSHITREEFLNKRFKTNPDFLLRNIADEYILISTANNNAFNNALISLNDTSAFLWNLFTNGATINEAVTKAQNEYTGEKEVIENNTINFILENMKFDLIREEI